MARIILVHGICHGGWCWERVVPALVARGHSPVVVDLPLTGLEDDAAIVRKVLDASSEPAVLVGHSYGGLVISRAAEGRRDVAHLVYVAAVLLDRDDIFLTRAAEFPLSPLGAGAVMTDGVITVPPGVAVEAFYAECPATDATAAAARLRPAAIACLAAPPEGEPWRRVPSTYVLCERDRAIVPEAQRWMSTRAGRVEVFDTDHSPFYSQVERLVELVAEAARAAEVDPASSHGP